jgi:MGT family glycosyltransferase
MTRRYLFALVDGGGNVPPELSAARQLVERGHDVTVLAEHSVADEVRATGATFRPWVHAPNRPDRRPEHDPVRDWECGNPWQLVERLAATMFVGPAPRYAQDVRAAIAELDPDLIPCSMFCVGAMVAAEAARRPFDVLIPNVYPLPVEGMPAFGLGLQPARGPLGRIRDRIVNELSERLWDRYGLNGPNSLNALRAEYGLAPVARFLDQARGARRHLVFTSPAFDFTVGSHLPDNVRYVGPVLDDPTWATTTAATTAATTTTPWTPPAGTDPLVLVALSSTFQRQEDTLQRIVDALSMLPVRAVVTTGQAIEPNAVQARANTTILVAASHRQILSHAALVVTHGGHGTAMKALAAGVPLVVLPHGRDQADTAARVVARGAGIALKRSASPRKIARAVKRVLDQPSFAHAARRLGDQILRDASGDALVRELEELPSVGASAGPQLTHRTHRTNARDHQPLSRRAAPLADRRSSRGGPG